MAELSPLEQMVRDQLAKAGEGNESQAFLRSWRLMALDALSRAFVVKKQKNLAVVSVMTHATELFAYNLAIVNMADAGVVTLARQGISEVMEFLDWCHTFFDHLVLTAEDLPAPMSGTMNIGSVAQANATTLIQLIGEMSDHATSASAQEEEQQEAADENTVGTVTISTQTFRALGKALLFLICAWLDPPAQKIFSDLVNRGHEELRDLRGLIDMNGSGE